MKALLLTILLMSGRCFAQKPTQYDKSQDSKISANALNIQKLILLVTSQQKTIDSLKAMSNTIWFYGPFISARDSILNNKKIGSIVEIKKI